MLTDEQLKEIELRASLCTCTGTQSTCSADSIPHLLAYIRELEAEKARLRMALAWTTHPPQAQGWYWVRSVCPDTGIANPAIAFYYNERECEVAKNYPYQWAGPIPEPQEPAS